MINDSGITSPVKRVTIFGAGSWGTALAVSLANSGVSVALWARRPEAAERMQRDRRNPTYLSGVLLPASILVTSDLVEATVNSEMWVFATPSQSVRNVAESVAEMVTRDTIVVSVAKGIENGTLYRTTEVLGEVLASASADNIGVLYGPSHAEEVAAGLPTTVVAAAGSMEVAEIIQDAFMTPWLRVYVNEDLIGVEIAGSVKNIMAIAAGISDGVGFGDNAKAAIITRGMAEMKRLGLVLGARSSTFAGLAGIGDLVVTCMSRHSRNRHVGEQLGRGQSLEEIEQQTTMIAEGVRTTISVHELGIREQIEMPITQAIHAILFEGMSPHDAVATLMSRSAKTEDWLPEVLL